MKPNAKAAGTKKAPARRKASARKPATTTAPANSKADETTGENGTASTAGPEVVQQPQATPAADPALPAPPAPPAEPEATTAAPETVNLGHVKAVGQFVPLGDVLGLLGKPSLERIAALHNTPAISDLAERVRVTDGRCAPVYFVAGKPPSFYQGVESLAAAKDAGVTKVFVVVVPSDELDFVQGYLVEMAHKSKQSASPT